MRQSRSDDPFTVAVDDNCRFDERASDSGWLRFDSDLSSIVVDRGVMSWPDWTETNKLHVDRYCHVPSHATPDAFLDINQDAWLTGLSENQSLVRIEAIARPLAASGMSLDEFAELHNRADVGDPDAQRAIDAFCDTWNQGRDGRPIFAAFYDELKSEADHDDWPHILRDRLGLGHYGLAGGTAFPVALMRYPLSDVLAESNARNDRVACALPTVLDDGMHEFFFPVPRESHYGATLHLEPDCADILTAETLHRRIGYRREHLWRVGRIESGRELDAAWLVEARDLHLVALQVATDRDDFGEFMAGRI